MNEYRFTLQKYKRGSKLSCPQCGKKQCFIRYVDTQGEVSFPDYVGRCDHEQSCKYHYTPSDYFKDNPTLIEKGSNYGIEHAKPQPHSLPPTSFIDKELMERTLTNYTMNPLYIYLVVYWARMKQSEYSIYIVLAHQKNGAALLSTGRLIGKATCEPER